MQYAALLIFFLSIFMLIYGILALLNKDKVKIEKRLQDIKELNTPVVTEDKLENKSFFERMLKPLYLNINRTILKITPGNKLQRLNKRLERAGLLKNNSPERFIYTKTMASLAFGLMIGMLSFLVEPNFFKTFALALLIAVSINVFFNFYVSKRIEARKSKILKDLPYTLDLITVSVEAGLSFDGAMARVIGNISGELCDEFAKSLKEIRMGIERKTALNNLSERCEVRELSMLVTALNQADDLGVSLSRVLRIEAANLRENRKQAAREKAMKAPVKMLIPLVFFIFPTVFIIILGPAVINMITIFGGK
jgi:tight adherence protein C